MTSPFSRSSPDTTELIGCLAQRLAEPQPAPTRETWRAHSLARGAVGLALFHIERAHRGTAGWQHAHQWISVAAAGEISASDDAGLYQGAPAVAFLLNAAAGNSSRYRHALVELDHHVEQLAHRRVATALDRIRDGRPAAFREYDIFQGLTGIGAHLLYRAPGGAALHRVLAYLVALTRPLRHHDTTVPGWWVGHDPHTRTSARYPTGHSNQGAAHGIAGPLLLLAHAARRGITVDGQHDAIATIQAWFDRWQQDGHSGPWWPEHITLDDLRVGRTRQVGPARPSWCYGTPGIARALQLAALATGDAGRQRAAERHLRACLSDPAQLARLTDTGLCHGWAGVYQTTWHTAQDAVDPDCRSLLPQLAEVLRHHTESRLSAPTELGFLDGDAGTALALTTAATSTPPISGWDTCLLIA